VARVALRKPGLRLKEMILSNPSRIVLDLVHDKPAARPVAKAPAPRPVAPPKPKPVAKQPAPKPEPAVPEPAPKPEPVAKAPLPPAPKPEVVPKPAPPAPEPVAKAPSPAPPPAAKPEPPAPPKPVPVAKPVAPKPQPIGKPRAPAPKPAQQAEADGLPIEILAGAAVGVLLCVVGLVVLLRRRRPGADERDELGQVADDGDAEQRSFTEMVFSETDAETPGAAAEAGGVSDLDSFFDDDSAAAGQPASMGDDLMSQGLSDLPTDRGAVPMPPAGPVASSPDPDVLRVVHELERRMGQLEGKLTEANEARERLERQVAAQSEELRVQRAAIARTQRALRSLSRGEEEKATEPALRDEDTQAKTRINV
jgi:hypothetical protein